MGSKTGGNAPSGEPNYIIPTYKSLSTQKANFENFYNNFMKEVTITKDNLPIVIKYEQKEYVLKAQKEGQMVETENEGNKKPLNFIS